MRRLINDGVLHEESATLPLSASYESGGWMAAFVMRPDLVSVFKAALVAEAPSDEIELEE